MENPAPESSTYTCNDYRAEMILLGLQKQLTRPDLAPEEKEKLNARILAIEKEMGMD